MKNSHLNKTELVFFLSLLMLSGCMTRRDDHIYFDGHCVTCLNNPMTGEAYNYRKSSPDYQQAKLYQKTTLPQQLDYQTGSVSLTVTQPVDTVYLRLKREFGFYTRKERERSFGQNKAWLENAEEYRYEALPGVSYHLRENIQHRYQNSNQAHTLDALIESNGIGTDIIFTYWVQLPQSSIPEYSNSIKFRALRVLQ